MKKSLIIIMTIFLGILVFVNGKDRRVNASETTNNSLNTNIILASTLNPKRGLKTTWAKPLHLEFNFNKGTYPLQRILFFKG